MQEEGRDPYLHTRFETDCKAQEILEHFEELENQPVSVAGRIMSRRGMGKGAFLDLRDTLGSLLPGSTCCPDTPEWR